MDRRGHRRRNRRPVDRSRATVRQVLDIQSVRLTARLKRPRKPLRIHDRPIEAPKAVRCAACSGRNAPNCQSEQASRRAGLGSKGELSQIRTFSAASHGEPMLPVTQGTLPAGKSSSGGGADEGKPGDGDRVPSGDKKRGIVRTVGGVKGGRNATCNQPRDHPCKSWSRRRAVT